MTSEEIEALRSIRATLGQRLQSMAKVFARTPSIYTNDQFGIIGTIEQIDGILEKWTKSHTPPPATTKDTDRTAATAVFVDSSCLTGPYPANE